MFLCIVNDGKGRHKKYNKQSLFIRNNANYSVEIQLHKQNKIRVRKSLFYQPSNINMSEFYHDIKINT